jgi:predicted DCC family thiol-disulfide oxidoreductase YuxK
MRPWMIAGAGRVEFFPSQGGMGEPFGFPAGKPMGAVHLIEVDGRVRKGAEAVFRMMSLCGSLPGRLAWMMYQHLPLFRIIGEWCYRRLAERRETLSEMVCRLPKNPRK